MPLAWFVGQARTRWNINPSVPAGEGGELLPRGLRTCWPSLAASRLLIPAFDSRSEAFGTRLPDIQSKVPPYIMPVFKLVLAIAGLGLVRAEPLRVNLKRVESKDRTGYVVVAALERVVHLVRPQSF